MRNADEVSRHTRHAAETAREGNEQVAAAVTLIQALALATQADR